MDRSRACPCLNVRFTLLSAPADHGAAETSTSTATSSSSSPPRVRVVTSAPQAEHSSLLLASHDTDSGLTTLRCLNCGMAPLRYASRSADLPSDGQAMLSTACIDSAAIERARQHPHFSPALGVIADPSVGQLRPLSPRMSPSPPVRVPMASTSSDASSDADAAPPADSIQARLSAAVRAHRAETDRKVAALRKESDDYAKRAAEDARLLSHRAGLRRGFDSGSGGEARVTTPTASGEVSPSAVHEPARRTSGFDMPFGATIPESPRVATRASPQGPPRSMPMAMAGSSSRRDLEDIDVASSLRVASSALSLRVERETSPSPPIRRYRPTPYPEAEAASEPRSPRPPIVKRTSTSTSEPGSGTVTPRKPRRVQFADAPDAAPSPKVVPEEPVEDLEMFDLGEIDDVSPATSGGSPTTPTGDDASTAPEEPDKADHVRKLRQLLGVDAPSHRGENGADEADEHVPDDDVSEEDTEPYKPSLMTGSVPIAMALPPRTALSHSTGIVVAHSGRRAELAHVGSLPARRRSVATMSGSYSRIGLAEREPARVSSSAIAIDQPEGSLFTRRASIAGTTPASSGLSASLVRPPPTFGRALPPTQESPDVVEPAPEASDEADEDVAEFVPPHLWQRAVDSQTGDGLLSTSVPSAD